MSVSFEHVTFTYPEAQVPALIDVNLDIRSGTFVLVAGPTGAGKSTFLRAINGLVPHFTGGRFEGRVIVEGRDTMDRAPRYLADVVAFVPQDPDRSFVVDRVEDELAYAMENLAVDPQTMRRRVEETLDLLDIAHLRDRSVRTLSGGERQRVAIAAALTPQPRVLVLDEPTSQLDPQGAEGVLAGLQRLVHDLGITVVIAEHRLERVAGFAEVVVGCTRGHVIIGDPAAALNEVGIGPPVSRLGRSLGWSPLPLTVREARRFAERMDVPERVSEPSPPVTNGPPLLTATDLRADYGAGDVLKGITLGIARGDIVAILGRNGSGKTTLLRCLTGLHPPSGGAVSFREHEPKPGVDVVLCPQSSDSILFEETVAGEVSATARDGGGAELLARFGIADLAASHPRDLSAGQRLLVATAAVAATGAPVLLLDEPTRGLDPDAKRQLASILRKWAEDGHAIAFATHDVELAAAVATRVIILANGEIITDGFPREVLADSPVFSPQIARVFANGWLTPDEVVEAVTAS